jgi:hypothetical protein
VKFGTTSPQRGFDVKLADVQTILKTEVICGWEHLDTEVASACGADLMSDVLVHSKE